MAEHTLTMHRKIENVQILRCSTLNLKSAAQVYDALTVTPSEMEAHNAMPMIRWIIGNFDLQKELHFVCEKLRM